MGGGGSQKAPKCQNLKKVAGFGPLLVGRRPQWLFLEGVLGSWNLQGEKWLKSESKNEVAKNLIYIYIHSIPKTKKSFGCRGSATYAHTNLILCPLFSH